MSDRPKPAAGPAFEISRKLSADAARVYRAFTDPKLLRRWWGPENVSCPRAELDVRPGGRYRIEMQMSTGDTGVLTGEYIEVEPERRLVFTWKWGETDEDTAVSRVEATMTETDGGTLLTVRHERFSTHQERDDHREGWFSSLNCLEAVV